MHRHYEDILERIVEPPTWFDENGTPRWGEFSPRATAHFYVNEAVLLAVECQNCGRRFEVCMSAGSIDVIQRRPALADQIRSHEIHYGDPPNMHCCPAGPTMNSVPRQVLQYWKQDPVSFEWLRDAALEIAIVPDWLADVSDTEVSV